MNDAIAIDLRNVVKRFGAFTAVDHIDLQIRDGEFFAMLGPSGCGKTTTLRMIAGFEFPSSGDIRLHGREMGITPPNQRPVNTVFQSYALFPHMTVEQNIAFGLQMKKLPKAQIGPQVQAALELVRLKDLGARYPRQLSGGQQQRVALARALVNQPEVLLLDEPLGALDQKLRKEMQYELKQLQANVGITFVFVTHDQEEALTMADRIAVMNQGRVLQVGTPTEIYERPNCRFVADFIGETNFIDGRVIGRDGNYTVLESGDGLRLRGIARDTLTDGTAATLSIRPEKLRLLPAQATLPRDGFSGTVTSVGYIGSDTRITVRLDNGRTIDVWEQNTRSTLDREEYWQPGEAAALVFPPENALVLHE